MQASTLKKPGDEPGLLFFYRIKTTQMVRLFSPVSTLNGREIRTHQDRGSEAVLPLIASHAGRFGSSRNENSMAAVLFSDRPAVEGRSLLAPIPISLFPHALSFMPAGQNLRASPSLNARKNYRPYRRRRH